MRGVFGEIVFRLRNGSSFDSRLDALPVGAFPEELVAGGAFEKFVEPFVGAGRDAVADLFFIYFDQFAAASHAAGFVGGGKVEFGADVAELFVHGEGGRNPEGADFAADDGTAVEQEAVGSEEDAAVLLGFADEFGVGDVLLPECFASGGAEPAGESAEAGIAMDAGRKRVNYRVVAFAVLTKWGGAIQDGDGDFGVGVAESWGDGEVL